MNLPSFHDGHFEGLRIHLDKQVEIFLRTQDGRFCTLALQGVDAMTFSEIKQGNIIFDLVLRNNEELTDEDIAELFSVDEGSSKASDLLKAKRDKGFQLLEVNSSYGAHGLVLFQKIEVRPSSPD